MYTQAQTRVAREFQKPFDKISSVAVQMQKKRRKNASSTQDQNILFYPAHPDYIQQPFPKKEIWSY